MITLAVNFISLHSALGSGLRKYTLYKLANCEEALDSGFKVDGNGAVFKYSEKQLLELRKKITILQTALDLISVEFEES